MVFMTMTISGITKIICFTRVDPPAQAAFWSCLPQASFHNIVVLSTMPLHRCLYDTSLHSD